MKNILLLLLSFFVLFISGLQARILLFTFHYNRPDFLELQCRCLNKFLKEKDDYELIVFNDAIDPKLKNQIIQVCENYNVKCIIYPQHLHHKGPLIEKMRKWGYDGNNGSMRHCQQVQYALDKFGYDHDDIVGIFEGDVFLTREFSLRQALNEYDLIGAVQTDRESKGIEYMWIGLCFFNIEKLPNKKTLSFDMDMYNDAIFLDSGGTSYYYLINNPTVPVKKYYRTGIVSLPRNDKAQLEAMGFSPEEISFLHSMVDYQIESHVYSLEFHMNYNFIHFACSRYYQGHEKKLKLFKDYLNNILSEK